MQFSFHLLIIFLLEVFLFQLNSLLINEREKAFNRIFESKKDKETLNMIKTLEERINTVIDKIKVLRKNSIEKKESVNEENYVQPEGRNLE